MKSQNMPWKKIVGLRNLIIHEYYIINHGRIWNVVDNDIPPVSKTPY